MATPEQTRRWQADWAATLGVVGQRIDSLRFHEGPDGTERITVVLSDGRRLGFEAPVPLRAWVRR